MRWEIEKVAAGSQDESRLLAQGWEPFAVTQDTLARHQEPIGEVQQNAYNPYGYPPTRDHRNGSSVLVPQHVDWVWLKRAIETP